MVSHKQGAHVLRTMSRQVIGNMECRVQNACQSQLDGFPVVGEELKSKNLDTFLRAEAPAEPTLRETSSTNRPRASTYCPPVAGVER